LANTAIILKENRDTVIVLQTKNKHIYFGTINQEIIQG
jgi:hypothetical protein